MYAVIIRLDYDDKTEEEAREWISFAAELLGVEVRGVVMRRSRSGNLHAYVKTAGRLAPLQQFLFRYYAGDDKKRINADVKRHGAGYPLGHDFLFYQYIHKPNSKFCLASEFAYWEYVLLHASRRLQPQAETRSGGNALRPAAEDGTHAT